MTLNNCVSGVYEIRNILNGHRYIGSSCNINHRWRGHILALNRGAHHSLYLQRSWDKWGKECFEFVVIEECTREELTNREQYYIDILRPEYNICQKAHSCLGLIRSEETRKKVSEAHKGHTPTEETRAKKSKAMMGHPYWGNREHSEETRAKMSLAHTGRKCSDDVLARRAKYRETHPVPQEVCKKISQAKMGHTTSEEAKKKMSEAKKGNTYNRGRIHTDEARKNMSAAHQKYLETKRLNKESVNV